MIKQLFFLIAILSLISCEENIKSKTQNKLKSKNQVTNNLIPNKNQSNESSFEQNYPVKIIVLQCSNGYGLDDFRYTLETEIKKNKNFEIIPFPNRKLLGVPFQGVYDKKYCTPIIKKIDVDYIIMTRYLGNIIQGIESRDERRIWGYETKILNTKSKNQIISIRKDSLKEYNQILDHIKENSSKLISDIKELK